MSLLQGQLVSIFLSDSQGISGSGGRIYWESQVLAMFYSIAPDSFSEHKIVETVERDIKRKGSSAFRQVIASPG